MSPKTQQAIIKLFARLFGELDDWLEKLGVSKEQIILIYVAVLAENGMMARFTTDLTAKVLLASPNATIDPGTIIEKLRHAESGDFAAWVLQQPEPSSEELNALLSMRDSLSNLRKHFEGAAMAGPRPKHGPKPRKLTDPAIREKIRAKITSLRSPGTKLDDIYARLENEYPGVKRATFKRVWQEGLKKDAEKRSRKGGDVKP